MYQASLLVGGGAEGPCAEACDQGRSQPWAWGAQAPQTVD